MYEYSNNLKRQSIQTWTNGTWTNGSVIKDRSIDPCLVTVSIKYRVEKVKVKRIFPGRQVCYYKVEVRSHSRRHAFQSSLSLRSELNIHKPAVRLELNNGCTGVILTLLLRRIL